MRGLDDGAGHRVRSTLDSPARTGLAAAGLLGAGWLAWKAWPGRSIRGEVALVTGGSRGLGFLIAHRLLEEGCRVAICARDTDQLEDALTRLRRETGGDVVAYRCDVADPDAVGRMVERLIGRFGRIDIVVNNASIIQVAPLEVLGLEDFESAMAINYMGTVHTTLAVLPHMRRRGHGRIANITSINGVATFPHLLPYTAAKFAAVGFSQGLRTEVAKAGIRVTTIVPGLMRTGSPVHVDYRGQPSLEYAWFTLGDMLPVSAMSARRAARRIVRAIRRGEAWVTLSWQAKLFRAMFQLAPGTAARFLGLVNRGLPGPGEESQAPGRALRGTLPEPAERALDRLGAQSNE